jgi:hypothetical protein
MPHTARNVVVVHMGLPKTGTTFLQDHVFRTCDQIADFGKTSSYKSERPDVDPALRMIATVSDAEFRSRLSSLRELLMREAEKAGAQNPGPSVPLLSYEGFFRPKSIHPLEIYGRLESIFGAVKVLLTIRQQFDLVTSWYLYRFYRFTQGGAPAFEVWATKRLQKRSTWNLFHCCDYWPVIKQLVARAGDGNVLVEPMEGLIRGGDPEALGRLADFLGVDRGALAEAFTRATPAKQRIDQLGFLFGRALYESGKADLSEEEMRLMKRVFRKVHTQLGRKHQKADVAPDVVARCFTDAQRAAIKDGNTALSRYLGRDLARFGYPVREVVETITSGETE